MKLFQRMLVASAALSLVAPIAAQAADYNLEDMNSYSLSAKKSNGLNNNFQTIQPGDWIFQSIQEVAESRGCNVVIPNKGLSRYDAAAILNSCLSNAAEVTVQERTLIDEFSNEIASINGRVDGIEARLNNFEAGSFSTTTTLDGKAVFAIGAIDGIENIDSSIPGSVNTGYVYQMNLNTSFTGDDNLYVRLKTGEWGSDWKQYGSTYHIETKDNSDQLKVDKIWYTFPIGDNVTAWVAPRIENYYMLAATPSIYKPGALKAFKLGGHGAVFGASTDTGAGLKYQADNGFAVSSNFVAKDGDGAGGIFTKEDTNKVDTMIAYTADNYHLSATYSIQSGGWDAFKYFGTKDITPTSGDATDANAWALRAWWRPDDTGTATPSVTVGYDIINFENHTNNVKEGSGYMVGLNWSDMFQVDDRIGVAFGQPVKATAATAGNTLTEVDPFLWEIYYSFRPNDSIEVTPAIFGGSDVYEDTADDIFGAVLTTTFKF